MAYTILSESYGRRLPKITAEADSTDDLAVLGIDYAEGSTCTVGEDEYVLDKVGGWVIRGSGGGGGDLLVTITENDGAYTADKTNAEIYAAAQAGKLVRALVISETAAGTKLDFMHLKGATPGRGGIWLSVLRIYQCKRHWGRHPQRGCQRLLGGVGC